MKVIDFVLMYDSTSWESVFYVNIMESNFECHSYKIDWSEHNAIRFLEKLHKWDNRKVINYRIIPGDNSVTINLIVK